MTTKIVSVPGINCGHCTQTIEMELLELAGVTTVAAEVESKQVTISWEAPASWEKIEALLVEIGFPVAG